MAEEKEGEREPAIKLFQLNDRNYNDWDQRLQNELYGVNADAIYTHSKPKADGSEKTTQATSVKDRTRRQAWTAVARAIPHSILKINDDVKLGDIEELLRRVRRTFYLPGTTTVSTLLEELQVIQLINFRDASEYMAQIRRINERLVQQGEKLSNSLILFYTLKGLPSDYDTVKRELNHEDPVPNLVEITKEVTEYAAQPNISGSTIRLHGTTDQANVANDANRPREVCRAFAKYGQCKWGPKCKFEHVIPPGGHTMAGKDKPSVKCTYCGIRGHEEKDCKKKKAGITDRDRCDNCNIIGHLTKDCRRKTQDKASVAMEQPINDDIAEDLDDFLAWQQKRRRRHPLLHTTKA